LPPEGNSPVEDQPRRLFSFEFVLLLIITLLVFCNVAVFYNLYGHLAAIGIPGGARGFLVGVFSLTMVPLFFFAAPFVDHRNAPYLMLIGMVVLACAGMSYLFVQSFWGMLVLRIVNGAGLFCMSASCIALLVWVIPEGKSGQGFALFSSAILIPYALVPLAIDAIAPWLPTRAHSYAVMPILLLPAALVVMTLVWRRKRRGGAEQAIRTGLPTWLDMKSSLTQLPIAVMILANGLYFTNFAGLFFLFKGFALQLHLGNVGKFFTVQMLIMLAIRTFGSGLFDRVSKVVLLSSAFALAACGFLALSLIEGPAWVSPTAVIFGVGLAMGYPSLNSLMYLYSEPRYRAMNANLMMMALQGGYFLGPLLGGLVVSWFGYHAFFMVWLALNLVGFAVCTLVLRTPAAFTLKKR
jgi:MFS family permease